MPAIPETTETDKPRVVESDTELAERPNDTPAEGEGDQGDPDAAEPLDAYVLLLA